MRNFEFYNPVNLIFGKDQLVKLPKLLPSEAKILLLYGGGSIFKNGVHKQVTENIQEYEVIEFGGIEPNPHFETCMEAVKVIKQHNLNYILAVGGGSVIDAAKFIAAAALFKGEDAWDILSKKSLVLDAIPFGAVLTLPATGSEMNSGSVITNVSKRDKLAFGSKATFPKFSILLPDAAGTLPKKQVANGVVDAFVHVIEQYLTYPAGAPLQDRFAESILQTLVEIGPLVVENPKDYDAMSNLMWCATMALNGLIGCGQNQDWAIHWMGHELTALHNIDHARTLAIVLPGHWRILKEAKREKLLQYGERVWGINSGDDEEKIERIISTTEKFFNSLGIETKLTKYDIPKSTIEEVANRFKNRGWLAVGDRNLITPEVVSQILSTQYE